MYVESTGARMGDIQPSSEILWIISGKSHAHQETNFYSISFLFGKNSIYQRMACVRNLNLINPSHPFIITLRMVDLTIWTTYFIMISELQVSSSRVAELIRFFQVSSFSDGQIEQLPHGRCRSGDVVTQLSSHCNTL